MRVTCTVMRCLFYPRVFFHEFVYGGGGRVDCGLLLTYYYHSLYKSRRRIEQRSRRAGRVFSRLTQLQNYMAPILAGARVEGTTPGEAEMRIGNPRGPANSTASRQPAQLHPSQQRQHTALPTGFGLPFSPNFRPFGFPTLPSSLGQQGQQIRMPSATGSGTTQQAAPAGSALQIVDISILSGPGGTFISGGGNTNGSALPTVDRRNLGGSANMAATSSSGMLQNQQEQQASATSALQAATTGSSTAPDPTAPSSTNDQRNIPATGGVGVDPLALLNHIGETLHSRRIANVSNLPALATETTLVDSAPLGASTANTATAATTSATSAAMGAPSARFDSTQLLRAQEGQPPAFQQTGTPSSSGTAQNQSRNTDQEPDAQIQALNRLISSLLPGLTGAGLGVGSEAAAGDASTNIQGTAPASANSSGQSQEQRPARFRTSGVMLMTGGNGDEWTTLGSWPMVFGPSGVVVGTGNGTSSPNPGASAQRQQRRDQSGTAAAGANSSRPAVSSRPPRSSPARSSPSPSVTTAMTSVPLRHRHGRSGSGGGGSSVRLRAQDAVYSLGRIGRLLAGVLRILDQPREDGSPNTLTDVLRDPTGQPMVENVLSGQLINYIVIGFDPKFRVLSIFCD